MGKIGALLVGVFLLAGPAWAHEKRADKCGCHHQYGLRHCHPKKKTNSCEAPVKAVQRGERRQPKPPDAAPAREEHAQRSQVEL